MRRRSSNHLQASKHTTNKVAVNKVAVNKVAVNKVVTPMIGFAAAVGTTTLPEEQNAINANNLVTRMQSWLNHLHSKAAMVNNKAVTVNNKAVTVNSKAVTVINQHTTNSQHTTDHQLAAAERMIGFALNAGTTISLSA